MMRKTERITDTMDKTEPDSSGYGRRVSEAGLRWWVDTAGRGAILEYYRGFLAVARDPRGVKNDECKRVRKVGDLAYSFAKQEWVHLLQRKNGIGDYTYLMMHA